MHDIYMSALGLAEDLEARTLQSSPQTTASGDTPRARARPTQDGRRSLVARQRGRDGWCGTDRFRRKTRDVFINLSKANFKKSSQALTTCNYVPG